MASRGVLQLPESPARSFRCDPQRIEQVIGLVYGAAIDSRRWGEVVTALVHLVDAERGLMAPAPCPGEPTGNLQAPARLFGACGFEPADALHYCERLCQIEGGLRFLPDTVFTRADLSRRARLPEAGAHANERVRMLGSYLRVDEFTFVALAFLRGEGGRCFGIDERRLLRRLLPHLSRALRIATTLDRLEGERQAARAALDWLPVGIALLDDAGSLLSGNRALTRLADGDGLSLHGCALRASATSSAEQLEALLRRMRSPRPPTEGVVAIERPSGRRPLHLVVQPVRSRHGEQTGDGRASAIVLVADPEHGSTWPAELLHAAYGLTDAEARVAQRIATGASLEKVAAALEIRLVTVRNHLKQIFEKTRTHRQAEVVALLRAPIESQPAEA